MSKISFPFVGEAYQSRSKNIAVDESINFYCEINKTGKAVVALIGRPGLKYHTTYAGNGGNRGMYTTGSDKAFFVIENKLVEFNTAGNAFLRGTLKTVTGQCSMADNGNELMIVDGTFGYVFNLNDSTFTCLTIADYPGFAANISPVGGVSHVVFIDGYFIVNKNNVQQHNIYYSAIYNGLSWSALDYVSAEGSPDGLLAIKECNNELYAFGNKSMQVFYNSGDPDATFAPLRVSGGHLDIGCYAPNSIDSIGQTVFWLGSNEQGSGIVWAVTGYQSTRISNHAIEYMISTMAETSDATGFCYQQEGHTFYVLTFPSGQKTIVYDMSTGMWHTRTTGSYPFWLGQNHCFMGTRNYVGDIMTGNIYYLDFDMYTDNGTLFETIRTCQHIHQDRKRLFFSSFEIDMERAVGLANDASSGESNPYAALRWSDDGGNTWSNWYNQAIGKKGEYLTRVIWYRLGSSRDRIFSVKIIAPVKRVITGAVMGFTVGAD